MLRILILKKILCIRSPVYSVVESDRNSYPFCGDVVLDSFNKASWNEDNNLDPIYERKHFNSSQHQTKIKF